MFAFVARWAIHSICRVRLAAAITLAIAHAASAQETPLQPGEAYVTRFSGVAAAQGRPTINTNGTVGGIIDVRNPGRPPLGQHWVDAPKRNLVTAGQVGQVFGVVLDDANPPNVYLAATSAFGLHRTANNAQWMPGMWGQGGGPGTIYRLTGGAGSTARAFAQVMLDGRPNSGAALGNLAYDRYNKQLFVSDLETGMIHRISLSDGSDLGHFDHGVQGRTDFLDVEMGARKNYPAISFDPNSSAHISDCPAQFERTPDCWNLAYSGRRVWGLGVYRNPALNNEVRLYYATWHSPAFNQSGWNNAPEDDKRNAVWSVRLGADGNFAGDVRRELIVPDFFIAPQDVARSGYSQPVSDISFSLCGPRPVMLLAERGGIRNLGLAAENPFAYPHEARTLRYELDEKGAWHAVGRYDIGFYDRAKDGAPYLHANCSGGAAFGLGYNENWQADPGKPDQFVWMTGDYLCSPDGPCVLPGQQNQTDEPQQVGQQSPLDDSQVHGIQGTAATSFEEINPPTEKTQPTQQTSAQTAVAQSYLVDTDIVVNVQGQVIDAELNRNDATKVGDIAIYLTCEGGGGEYLVPSGEPPSGYHYTYGSHSNYWSHSRFGSHNPYWSHNRYESHQRWNSHWRYASHDRRLSHQRNGSHDRYRSHWRTASHDRRASHQRVGSHDRRASHAREGSHDRVQSHNQTGSHNRVQSHNQTGSHNRVQSHNQTGSHNTQQSHNQSGSHNRVQSHNQTGSHNTQQSHNQTGSHNRVQSHNQTGSHNTQQSHNQKGSHNTQQSHNQKGSHNTQQSHNATGSHNRQQSHNRTGSHSTADSRNVPR